MKSITEKQAESKLNDFIAKRNFYNTEIEKWKTILKAIRETDLESNDDFNQNEWDLSYLQLKRDPKAYGRLKLFKWYIQKMGGRARRDDFRKEINKRGDDVTENAWWTFLENNASSEGLKAEENGFFTITQ